MARLTVQQLDKYFGERALFTGLSFEIGERDKIGLVGDNGCGKSTLLRILTGEEPYDGGQVVKYRDTAIGYMEQHTCRTPERTLWDEVQSVFAPVMALEQQLETVHAALAAGDTAPALLQRQHTLREQFEAMGGLYYKSRVRATLLGLGFDEAAFATPVGVLSGGQRSKAAMGRLLLAQTNLLLLDEPTNHLDIPSVEWLEEYIRDYPGAVVVISHDRYFLDKVTTRTIELKQGRLYDTAGNYSRHKQQRETDRAIEQKHYQTALQEIRHIEENITLLKQWNREKSILQAESRQKRADRLRAQLAEPEKDSATLQFSFATRQRSGNEVLIAEGLAKALDRPLFRDTGLSLYRGERLFILGPNGCGKTTLLKILSGRLAPDAGYVRLGAKVSLGYYDQVQQGLDSQKTALQELWDTYPQKTETELRGALAAFLFRGDEVFKPIGVMSGGERARLLLLKRMLAGDNLLLLDEPTNHLDIAAREALEAALAAYEGTVLVVSHDRYFIHRMASRVMQLTQTALLAAGADYDAYAARQQTAPATPATPTAPRARTNDYRERKERDSALRRLGTAVRRAEERVAALEAEIAELNQDLESPAVAADYARLSELTAALDEKQSRLTREMENWEELQTQLEQAQTAP